LTRFLKIRSDLPVGLICRSRMQKFDLPWRQIRTQGERAPHGEEPAQAGVSNHEARGPSFETRAPDSASALPGKRAPQDEVQIKKSRRLAPAFEKGGSSSSNAR
jgi:hypothetical protein